MNRVILLTFALGVAASSAWADIPLPPDQKYIVPRVRFDGVEEHKDYVFHLRYLIVDRDNRPDSLVEIKNNEPFDLNVGRGLSNMKVLATEHKEFERLIKDDPSLKWLREKKDGLLVVSIKSPPTVGSVKAKEVPVTAYKVSITGGKLRVEPSKKQKASADAEPDNRLSLAAFGVFSALSIVGLGLWFARRRHPGS